MREHYTDAYWNNNEGKPQRMALVTEPHTRHEPPSDEEIKAVAEGKAEFIPGRLEVMLPAKHSSRDRLPSKEEIEAVRHGKARFFPRGQTQVLKLASAWRAHLEASHPTTEPDGECDQIIKAALLLGMNKSNKNIISHVSRVIEDPLITLAQARRDHEVFQMSGVAAIKHRLVARRST
ncbi:MAG TPA: hypothetical protein VMR59_03155 [Patescibacteria group bacterium]|jgi:hypothetical protein|nr:hypothetical protein [Patescibacteria group bacterium]